MLILITKSQIYVCLCLMHTGSFGLIISQFLMKTPSWIRWVSTLGVNLGCQPWATTPGVNPGCQFRASNLGVNIWHQTWVSILCFNVCFSAFIMPGKPLTHWDIWPQNYPHLSVVPEGVFIRKWELLRSDLPVCDGSQCVFQCLHLGWRNPQTKKWHLDRKLNCPAVLTVPRCQK